MAAVHARPAAQGADVFGAAAGSPGASRLAAGRLAGRGRALSCGPAPRVGGGLEARPRAPAARARLPQRSTSAHPRAWRVSCQRLGGPKEECVWGAAKAEEERAAAEEDEEELAGVGACALGVIGNVLEAAVFEQSDEFDCEADSELDDSDAEEASSSASTTASAAAEADEVALARLAESKLGTGSLQKARPQELLLSGCNTPSLIDDDDYEEVLSLASDDAFDEACHGERAMIYVEAAMRVAKGATEGALEEEYRFQEEAPAGAPALEAAAAGGEGPEAEDGDDDGDRSTIAPDEVQEVFQEAVFEDVAFDCVCELVDEGLSCAGAPQAAPSKPRAAEVKAAMEISHEVASDVDATRPELTPLREAPVAPEVASSAPEPVTLAESPGDAPEQAPAMPAFEALSSASASKISRETTEAAATTTDAASVEERAPGSKAAAARPPAPSDEDWSAILADLQREAAAQPPTPAAPVKPAKPTAAKGAVRPVRGADRPPAAPRGEREAPPAPALAASVAAKPAAAAEPETGAEAANPGTAVGNKSAARADAPPAAPGHLPQGSPPMSASRSRRRIIGGVVRAPVEVERDAAVSAGAFKKGMLGGPEPTLIQRQQVPQKATAVMFRLDRHDGSTADPAKNAAARESSLTKGYDALGVEFHRLDEDDWRRGPFSRQPSQGSLARGPSALGSLAPVAPAARLKGPLGAASALVLDLGEGAAGSSWNRAEPVQGRPPLDTLDALGRSSSSSGLRVTKALPHATQAAGASRTSSGSLAWSMRMARSTAKRNGLAEAF